MSPAVSVLAEVFFYFFFFNPIPTNHYTAIFFFCRKFLVYSRIKKKKKKPTVKLLFSTFETISTVEFSVRLILYSNSMIFTSSNVTMDVRKLITQHTGRDGRFVRFRLPPLRPNFRNRVSTIVMQTISFDFEEF